jgi:hypothetical protein
MPEPKVAEPTWLCTLAAQDQLTASKAPNQTHVRATGSCSVDLGRPSRQGLFCFRPYFDWPKIGANHKSVA